MEDRPGEKQHPVGLDIWLQGKALLFQNCRQDVVVAGGEEQTLPLGIGNRFFIGLVGKQHQFTGVLPKTSPTERVSQLLLKGPWILRDQPVYRLPPEFKFPSLN